MPLGESKQWRVWQKIYVCVTPLQFEKIRRLKWACFQLDDCYVDFSAPLWELNFDRYCVLEDFLPTNTL